MNRRVVFFNRLNIFVRRDLFLRLLIRRERRSRWGWEQNLDESHSLSTWRLLFSSNHFFICGFSFFAFSCFFISGFLKLLVSMIKLQRMCVQCRDFDSNHNHQIESGYAAFLQNIFSFSLIMPLILSRPYHCSQSQKQWIPHQGVCGTEMIRVIQFVDKSSPRCGGQIFTSFL